MTPEKYQRLRELLEQALDASPGQRTAFIRNINAADPELARELESLLRSHTNPCGDETRTMDMPLVRFNNLFFSEAPSFAPGELLLERFRIVRFIGRGGMGEVYEADDLQLGSVALKTIRTDLADNPNMLARFRQEVQLARKVTSPNVCRIHDLFSLPAGNWRDAAAFLTMEFLEGVTLADQIDSHGGLAFPEAERTALELCAALQAIHEAGVIHRDIKGRNVMLAPRRGLTQAVVMDLGLARESAPTRTGEAGLTRPGAIMGTPQYMAPEQFRGLRATPATDIYALGVLLYEIATGKHPFQGSTPLAAALGRAQRPAPASSEGRNIPRRWDDVINRCLEYDPDLRYQSANEVAESLRRKRFPRVPRRAAHAAGAVLLTAGAGGLALSYLLNPASHPTEAVNGIAKTIVVLPFGNPGGEPSNQAFSDGLQETVEALISQTRDHSEPVFVVPLSDVRENQVKTIADARTIFNADAEFSGSVQWNAGVMQLTLNLNDSEADRQRVLLVKPNELASLPRLLADQIVSLLGEGFVLPPPQTATGQTTRDSDAYKLYLQGEGYLRNDRPDDAVDSLEKAAEIDPEFTVAAAKLAEAFVRKYALSGDANWIERANSVLGHITPTEPTADARLAQATIWHATGDIGKAESLLRQLNQSEPDNSEVRRMLAETLTEAGKSADAEEILKAAIRRRPGYWPAQRALAAFYIAQHDDDGAERAFLAGIADSPDIPVLHSELGTLYFNLSRWEDSVSEFGKALDLRSYAPDSLNLGAVLFAEGKYAEAAAQFERAAKLQPGDQATWGDLGDARWQMAGEHAQAREAFQEAYLLASRQMRLNPDDIRLQSRSAVYLAKLGRVMEARKAIEAAIAQAPEDRNVKFEAARVYAVIGDSKRAATELSDCIALGYALKEVGREPDLARIHAAGSTKPSSAPVIEENRHEAASGQDAAEVANLLPPTILEFRAEGTPRKIGDSVDLTWNVIGAGSVLISPQVGTSNASAGRRRTAVTSASTTYTLTARGKGGESTAQFTVAVGNAHHVVGTAMESALQDRVAPVYPAEAIAAGVEGTVRLAIIVGADGRVMEATAESGDPRLVDAARSAVMKYFFRPYKVNGQPIEVSTEMLVRFNLPSNR